MTYVVFVLISEIANYYTSVTFGTSFPVMQITLVVGLVWNSAIYLALVNFKQHIKKAVKLTTAFFLLLAIANLIWIEGLFVFPSNGLILQSFLIIPFALITYTIMLNQPSRQALYQQPLFWFNSGNFIFYGITFFAFAFYNQIFDVMVNNWIYDLIRIANFIIYSFFFISIYLNQKQRLE